MLRKYSLCGAIAIFATLAPLLISSLAIADAVSANPVDQLLNTRSCPECDLHNANLEGARLNGANLSLVKMRSANLRRAVLVGANLTGAYLRDSTFEGADLRRVNFVNADLGNVNFQDADLRGAKLNAALFKDTNTQGVKFCRTIMPNGKPNNRDCGERD